MQLSEIKAVTEARLAESLGADRVGEVSVRVVMEDDGNEYLDIWVRPPPGRGLPAAIESIAATREVGRSLAEQGEMRFPNVFFRAAAKVA